MSYSVTVRERIMVAHSFKGEYFGPAQALHGVTFVIDAKFHGNKLDVHDTLIDVCLAEKLLKEVNVKYHNKNLDDFEEFEGRNTTMETMCKTAYDMVVDGLYKNPNAHFVNKLTIIIYESDVASAEYSNVLDTDKLDKLRASQKEEKKEEVPILYGYWRSSCTYRVRLALAIKGIKYENKVVNLLKNGQKSDEYKEISTGQQLVPTFVHNGKSISQSIAILEYIEEVLGGSTNLLPKDAYLKSKVRQLSLMIAADIQPVQNLRVLKAIEAAQGKEERFNWGQKWITEGFKQFEALVKKTHGKYCVGDSVSFADVCLIPQIYNARRFKVDLDQFPTILAIEKELNKIKALEEAHPAKFEPKQ